MTAELLGVRTPLAIGLPQHSDEHPPAASDPPRSRSAARFIGSLQVGVILADIQRREDSTGIAAAVTRGRMALVCAVAGLSMVGGFLVVNAIE